ncbi:Protoheme IX farnesyltransferase, mitochondrial [Umbelopsis sp. WA50703]
MLHSCRRHAHRIITSSSNGRLMLQNRNPTILRLSTTTSCARPIPDNEERRVPAVTKYKPITIPTVKDLPQLYKELVKAKLAGLVALTAMAGFAMAPGAASVSTLLYTTAGTALCIGSANAINQWIEIPYDAQMLRTRNRVLGRRSLSPFHAWTFGLTTGIVGTGMLYTMVNPLTAALGALNIFIYTGIYTPMKRASIANTWAGAVVGGIPPMMGWAAVTNSLDLGAWILGAYVYAWQFPHFNSLAWNLRADYSKAGYRMMSVTDPKLNARVALRYSALMFPLCLSMPYLGMTTWWFALDSSVINGALLYGAYRFWRNSNEKSARQLFFGSLINLPLVLALMIVHKEHQQPIYLDEDLLDDEEWVEEVKPLTAST